MKERKKDGGGRVQKEVCRKGEGDRWVKEEVKGMERMARSDGNWEC